MCRHYNYTLCQEHRHHINSPEHENCVLCLVADKGPMTQEQVASYLGVTKEWVSQIEKKATMKLKDALKRELTASDIPSGVELDVSYSLIDSPKLFNIKALSAGVFDA